MIPDCTETSSADSGSSRTMISGSTASARAMPTRWRCPPESWCGIAAGEPRRQADEVEQRVDPPTALVATAKPVDGEHLLERAADGDPRVERGVRVLEHQLHPPAELAEGAMAEAGDVAAVELDAPGRRVLEAHEQPRQRRLAAAGLADDAQRLAATQPQRHAGDRRATSGAVPRTG